jgi:hypothetical protein
MSTGTKDAHSATDSPNALEADANLPFSEEEAEHVASRFKPAWETDEPDDASAFVEAVPVAARDAGATATAAPVVHPPVPGFPQPESAPQVQAIAVPPADWAHPGPILIIADIPKRTAWQIKDEPSVVLPDEPMDHAPLQHSAPTPVVLPPAQLGKRSGYVMIVVGVVGVVAIAGLVVLVARVTSLVSDLPATPSTNPPEPAQAVAVTIPEQLPTAPARLPPVVSTTTAAARAQEERSAAPTTAGKASYAHQTPARRRLAQPKATKAAEPKPERAAPPAPKSPAEPASPAPKPRKPSAPPAATATSRPPAGGIVRDAPF